MKTVRANPVFELTQMSALRQASAEAINRSRASYLQSQRLLRDIDSGVITELPVTWGITPLGVPVGLASRQPLSR